MEKYILITDPNFTYRKAIISLASDLRFDVNYQPTPEEAKHFLQSQSNNTLPCAYFIEPICFDIPYKINTRQIPINTPLSLYQDLIDRKAPIQHFYILTDLINVNQHNQKTWENTPLIDTFYQEEQYIYRTLESKGKVLSKSQIDNVCDILENFAKSDLLNLSSTERC